MDKKFPDNFLWGAATAAPQVEGSYNVDGRTESIWDVADPKRIKYGDNCHSSCEHYKYYKEDVALMKELGLKSYRFSISWSRVIPERGKVNPLGLKFYNDLVDELISNGIEPLVTIFHWDLPVWVERLGGWHSKKIIELFGEYTKVLVDSLSDRVKYWITINEPQCFITGSYVHGYLAPFKRERFALAKLSTNCMLAHANAVKIIREFAKTKPFIGIAMASGAFVPRSTDPKEIEFARQKTFDNGSGLVSNKWWMDPLLAGKPVVWDRYNRTKEKDMKEINQPLDFVGVNVYQAFNYLPNSGDDKVSHTNSPRSSMGWVVEGRALSWTLRFVYERYHLPIMITENGMADNDFPCLDGEIHDPQRITFIHKYLHEVREAIADGVPVLGYQYWSLFDNFEWAGGYEPRFGLIYVDYDTKKRIIKDSGYEYKKIIESNGSIIK